MKKLLLLPLLACTIFIAQAQTLVSKTLIGSFSKQELDSLLLERLGSEAAFFSTRYGVDAYKVVYNTYDHDSTIRSATGLLAVPNNISCDFMLVNYSHGTTSMQEDVPSRLNGEGLVGLVAASNGMVMCEPDYFGMGDGTWPHYYLHAFTQAMTNIDLLRATREACQELSVQLNNQLYIAGYSQGGFSTMVTHKYIQQYFSDEFSVTKSFPGAGSYDMSGAMVDLMLSDVSYPSPGYLPFLLFTWNPIYHLFDNPSDYFRAPYDETLPPLINGLNSIGQINDFMPDTPKLIFREDVMNDFANNPNHPLRLALKDNDIYEWTPQAPMLMVHCLGDRQVPIANTRNTYRHFVETGATQVDTIDLNPSFGHGDCGEFYLLYLKGVLDSIVSANPCNSTAIEPLNLESDFSVYPNPARAQLTLRFNDSDARNYWLTITDLNGKIVQQEHVAKTDFSAEKTIATTALPNGIYLLKTLSEKSAAVKKIAIMR